MSNTHVFYYNAPDHILEILAEYDIHESTYGEDSDGNRGSAVISVDVTNYTIISTTCEEFEDCVRCGGSGEVLGSDRETWHTCTYCNGTGDGAEKEFKETDEMSKDIINEALKEILRTV